MKLAKYRRPVIACEFTSSHLVAARVTDNGMIDRCCLQPLPPGTLLPNLVETNITDREAVRTALEQTLETLATRGRDVAVILPDACCRIMLIDLEVVPERPEEADTLIRLRLKKSLPFDVDKARVSWQVQVVDGKPKVLAAITLSAVLEEYESVVREAGCSPGLVLPSILALLREVDATLPTLLIKVAPATTTIAMVNDGAVVLVRVLDRLPGQDGNTAAIADDVYPSLMFFQDVYGARLKRIFVSGDASFEPLNAALQESTGIRVQELSGAERLEAGATRLSALGAVAAALA